MVNVAFPAIFKFTNWKMYFVRRAAEKKPGTRGYNIVENNDREM